MVPYQMNLSLQKKTVVLEIRGVDLLAFLSSLDQTDQKIRLK